MSFSSSLSFSTLAIGGVSAAGVGVAFLFSGNGSQSTEKIQDNSLLETYIFENLEEKKKKCLATGQTWVEDWKTCKNSNTYSNFSSPPQESLGSSLNQDSDSTED